MLRRRAPRRHPPAASHFICRLVFFPRNLKDCLPSTSISMTMAVCVCCALWGNSLWRLSICQSERMTEPHRPDLPSCSASCRHSWNRAPRCSPDQGRISAAPSPPENTGGRARSGCSGNPALVISQLMSSPCYLSVETHGFAATASVAAIF